MMINYKKIERIAEKLEEKLGCGDVALADEKADAPVPCVEACGDNCMTASERQDGLNRLIKMAKNIKANKNLSRKQKQAALDKIRKVATSFTINKSVLDRPAQGDAIRSMNTQGKINNLTEGFGKNMTVNDVIDKVKQSGMNVNVMKSLLSKPLGSIPCQEVIKLGPALAKILSEYERMKNSSDMFDLPDETGSLDNTTDVGY